MASQLARAFHYFVSYSELEKRALARQSVAATIGDNPMHAENRQVYEAHLRKYAEYCRLFDEYKKLRDTHDYADDLSGRAAAVETRDAFALADAAVEQSWKEYEDISSKSRYQANQVRLSLRYQLELSSSSAVSKKIARKYRYRKIEEKMVFEFGAIVDRLASG